MIRLPADPITRWAEAVWVSGPIRIQRRIPATFGIVGDWHGIALVPPIAVASMIIIPVAYFVIGATTLGYVDVYSEWIGLMVSFVVLGAISGQLGVLAVLAFAFGDFFVGHEVWTLSTYPYNADSIVEQVIRTRAPLIISYLLLLVPVIAVPRLGKTLILRLGRTRRLPTQLGWFVATPMVLVTSWIGVRSWVAAAPTLLRPYFFWVGKQPTTEAIINLQEHGSSLVGAAVAATLSRQLVMGLFVWLPVLYRSLDRLEARAFLRIGPSPNTATATPPPKWRVVLSDLIAAFASALVLAGIVETLSMWIAILGLFVLVRLAKSNVLPVPGLARWRLAIERVPAPLRLIGLWVIASVATQSAVIGSYSAMAWAVVIGVIATYALFPGRPAVGGGLPTRSADPTDVAPAPQGRQ